MSNGVWRRRARATRSGRADGASRTTLTSQTVVPQVGRRRLAVLPPINLMNDPEQEYFVQGMHNALISELQRAGVAVIARTSVLQYAEHAETGSPDRR